MTVPAHEQAHYERRTLHEVVAYPPHAPRESDGGGAAVGDVVPAHDQAVTNRYSVAYPEHEPREGDPHYRDFEAYRRRTKGSARCKFSTDRGGDFSECAGGLELHHGHIEYAMINGVDLALLEARYPGVSNRDEVGEWVNGSPDNLVWYCAKHHRSHGGIHHASAADWEAEHFVRNLIT